MADSLSLRRTRICVAGQPRVTPTGTPLNGVYPDNFYVGQVIERDEFDAPEFDRDLQACIQLGLNRLEPSLDGIRRLRDAGARLELFVGWIVRGNGGVELEPVLLGRLSDLGITLSLDVYGKSAIHEE